LKTKIGLFYRFLEIFSLSSYVYFYRDIFQQLTNK